MQNYDLSFPLVFAVGALFFAVRWVFKPSRPRTGRPDSGPGANLGMLTAVLNHTGRAKAISAKDRLSQLGIRCSLSRIEADCYDVLVFVSDAERALALLQE